jgi:hypothetical protein
MIIANDDYEHPGLGQLLAPSADAAALSEVLGDEQIGDFAVEVVRNEPAHIISEHIEELFSEARPADVLLLHLSCHGLKSESGELFFAAVNTRPGRLGSTAVSADFVQRCMRTSRAGSVVLLLDCCYGGAFAQGVAVRAAGDVNVLGSFPRERLPSGRGRAVITASSAMEYAFEGDQLADDGHPRPSVFTSALVQGLATGDADRNQDGWVSLDELYDYVFDKVREHSPHQTPSRDVEMQGELLIARRSRPVTTPAPLPPELVQAIDHPMAGIRTGAVQELTRLLRGGHAGLALAARMALADLSRDDSRSVSAAAAAVLEAEAPTPTPTAEPPGPAEASPPAVPERPADPSPPAAEQPAEPTPPTAEHAEPRARSEPAPASAPEVSAAATGAPATYGLSRLLAVAGVLNILIAVLPVIGLYQTYAPDFRLLSYPTNVAQTLIGAVASLAAGVFLLVPRTSRRLGTGLALGSAATLPSDAGTFKISMQIVESPGPDAWIIIVTLVLVLVATGLVSVYLARSREIRLDIRSLAARPSVAWLLVLLGATGAVAYLVQIAGRHYLNGLGDAPLNPGQLAPVFWLAIMALVIPVVAATARQRSFSVGLLAGWICAGLAELIFLTGLRSSVLGYTLIALAVLLIPLAGTDRQAGVIARDQPTPAS